MNNTEFESSIGIKNRGKRGLAALGVLGGLGMLGIAVHEMDEREAREPADAIGSVELAGETYFLLKEELPFGALAAVGAVAVIASLESLRKPDEE